MDDSLPCHAADVSPQPRADDEANEREKRYAGHERAAKYDGRYGGLSWDVMRRLVQQ